jgi:two-component system, cell cycle sensor histidine kinase and response regulator CckA
MNKRQTISCPPSSLESSRQPDFRVLFESAPGLYLVVTSDLRIVAASDAYLQATMTKRDEILGRGVFDVFPDNPRDPTASGVRNLKASLERVIKGRVSDAMAVQKYDIRRPDSEGGEFEERYWSPANFPVCGATGEVTYIIHRVEDVTEFARRKGIEENQRAQELRTHGEQIESELAQRKEELRNSLELSRMLIESTRDYAVFMLDPQGNVLTWNPGAERIKGYKAEEIIGRHFSRFYPKDDVDKGKPQQELQMALAKGRHEDEGWRIRKDGSRFWANVIITALRDESRKVSGFSKITRDMSETKQAEENSRRLIEEEARRKAAEEHAKEIWEQREQLRVTLDCIGDGVITTDAHGRINLLNPVARTLTGWSDEAIGMALEDVFRIVNEDTRQAIENPASLVLSKGVITGLANHTVLISKDGAQRPIAHSAAPIRDKHGRITGMVIILRDVSEQRLAQKRLQEGQERFQELTEHIDQVLWVIDVKESSVLYVSRGYEQMWGRSCQSLFENPTSYMQGIHPLDQEMMIAENATMFKTGQIDVECRVLRPDESVRWVWIRGYPILEQGQIVRIVGAFEDITEKKRLAMERDALLSRIKLHIERMPLAYVLFDENMRIIDWNPAAERIFGYSKEEMQGEGPPYEKIVPGSFRATGEEILSRIRSGDMKANSMNENLTKDGRTITCRWFNTPLMDDSGQFVGFLCLAEDVTERKTLEAQFQHSQKMEVVGHLAGGVAHDFNNLLAVILGCCGFLENDATLKRDSRDLVEDIYKAANRAATLTGQLLAFSRQQILQPTVLVLNEVVTEAVAMLERLIGENIALRTGLDARLRPVKVDAGQMTQVIMNLALNARDAMPEGGLLTIETANRELDETYARAHRNVKAGSYVVVSISDTGCGMDEQTKGRMFEPFFTTKGAGKGTGLGLATVFGIVKQSGGHITAYSEVGKGTTFKVYLPAHETPTQSKIEKKLQPALPRGSETVLLVEDEEVIRNLLCRILESQGYTLLQAGNGDDALPTYEGHQGPIHLILTDVVMPKMGGRQLYDRLRARQPDLKVLYMSGYTDDAVIRHGVLEVETNFIEKPFTYAAMATKVRAILDQ